MTFELTRFKASTVHGMQSCHLQEIWDKCSALKIGLHVA